MRETENTQIDKTYTINEIIMFKEKKKESRKETSVARVELLERKAQGRLH